MATLKERPVRVIVLVKGRAEMSATEAERLRLTLSEFFQHQIGHHYTFEVKRVKDQ